MIHADEIHLGSRNSCRRICLIAVFLLSGWGGASAQVHDDNQPLRLVQTIPLPDVKGRLDHMDVDTAGRRLFVAGLENGTLEVVDLKAGKHLRSLPGFKKPQGPLFVRSLNKLFVASGDDAMVRVFRGDDLALLDSIQLEPGPNRITYDPHSKLVYVGYGGKDAGKDYGEVGIIDARTDRHVGDIKALAHPAELLLSSSGATLYAYISIASKLQVIDTKKREVTATWDVSSQLPGDGAFDEASFRLFIGTRRPAQLIVMDPSSGKEVAQLPTVEGQDGVYFDRRRKRVYVSGGREMPEGFVYIYHQKDADQYEFMAKTATRGGSCTSFWSPELDRYFVAVPANDKEKAAVLVYAPQH